MSDTIRKIIDRFYQFAICATHMFVLGKRPVERSRARWIHRRSLPRPTVSFVAAMPAHELSAVLLAGTLTVTAAVALGEKTHVWWMTESGVAILVGMFVGLAMWLYAVAQDDVEEETAALEALEFNPEIFTLLLLPPIIFESGFALNHRFFFSNIGSILVFAFLGTLVAFSVLAPSLYYGLGGANGLLTPMEACAFAALVSAVDPVATLAIFSSTGADPKLNALIFGESVLNDAVAIVLFKTVVQLGKHGVGVSTALGVADVAGAVGSFMLIFAGSCLVGVLGGTLIALFFKMTALRKLDAHAAPIAELICLICLSYATFLVAEYARLSGIVAALFAGAVCVMCASQSPTTSHDLPRPHTTSHDLPRSLTTSQDLSRSPYVPRPTARRPPTRRRYVKKNLTEEGAALCVTVIHAVAKFAETIIFVLIGCGFWLYLVGKIRCEIASDGFQWLPMASDCFRLLLDCFRLLPIASGVLPPASDGF